MRAAGCGYNDGDGLCDASRLAFGAVVGGIFWGVILPKAKGSVTGCTGGGAMAEGVGVLFRQYGVVVIPMRGGPPVPGGPA